MRDYSRVPHLTTSNAYPPPTRQPCRASCFTDIAQLIARTRGDTISLVCTFHLTILYSTQQRTRNGESLMTLDTVVNKIYGVFKAHAGDRRLILLHPGSRYRTALVSRMLVDDSLPVFYYAMGSDDIDIPSFVAGFTHDMAEQVPTFGSAINLARLQSPQDLTTLLEGFAQDIDQLHEEPFILLLDEFDRATIGDDLEMLLEALVDYLPERCRLVISSRKLPRFPWMSLIAQQKAD